MLHHAKLMRAWFRKLAARTNTSALNYFLYTFLATWTLLPGDLLAQKGDTIKVNWARQGQGLTLPSSTPTNGVNDAFSITIDSDQNAIAVGQIMGQTTFGSQTLTTDQPAKAEMAMVKYDKSGTMQWVKKVGQSGSPCPPGSNCSGPVVGYGIAASENDLHVTGKSIGRVVFGQSPGGQDAGKSSTHFTDAFVVRYQENGSTVDWHIGVGGSATLSVASVPRDPTDICEGRVVATDLNGNVVAAGTFEKRANLVSTVEPLRQNYFVSEHYNVNDGSDVYLVKLNAQGQVQWGIEAVGEGVATPHAVTVDTEGNIYLAGIYSEKLGLRVAQPLQGPGGVVLGRPVIYNFRDNPAGTSMFIVKFSPSGEVLWATDAGNGSGGAFSNKITGIVTDEQGNVFASGSFAGQITLGGTSLTSVGGDDIFVARFNEDGEIQWAKKAGGTGTDAPNGLTRYGGLLYLVGFFNGTAVFGEEEKRDTLFTLGVSDQFIATYNLSGEMMFAQRAGWLDNDKLNSIAGDSTALYVAGSYRSEKIDYRYENEDDDDPLQNPARRNNIIVARVPADTSVVIKVVQTGPDEARYVELWSLEQKKSVIKKIGEDDRAIFLSAEIGPMDVHEVYILRENKTLMGKLGFRYLDKNRREGRRKESIVTVHNDLASYFEHPIESTNPAWAFKWYYKYDFAFPLFASFTGKIIHTNHYPTTLLVPPVNDDGDYLLDKLHPSTRPVIFVHGVSGNDNYWGVDEDIIDPEVDNAMNDFNGKHDYPFTSYPGRLRALPGIKENFDIWEFYYPSDQNYVESGFLLSRDIKQVTSQYGVGKASILAHSMGGLVTRSYIEDISFAYDRSGKLINRFFDNDIDRVLFMATPQNGAFGGNRVYWRIYLPDLLTAVSGKDVAAPAYRELGIGSHMQGLINRKTDLHNHNVLYQQISGSTHHGLIPDLLSDLVLREKGNEAAVESRYNSDGAVSMSSGSLLAFGVDVGYIAGFSHGHFNSPDAGHYPAGTLGSNTLDPVEKQFIPTIASDYLLNGTLTSSRAIFLDYADGSNPVFAASDRETDVSPVYFDVAAPLVSFRKPDGDYWKPILNRNTEDAGIRFHFTTENIGGKKVGVLDKQAVNWDLSYHDIGYFLYYAHNNYSSDWKEIHKTSTIFYPYAKPGRRSLITPNWAINPLNFVSRERIRNEGFGWQLPNSQRLNLELYLRYGLAKYSKNLEANIRGGNQPFGYLSSEGDLLRMRWCQTTYNIFPLNEAQLNLLDSRQYLDHVLVEGLFDEVPRQIKPHQLPWQKATGAAPGLINYIDPQTETTSFVLHYDTLQAVPNYTLEKPDGTIITPADNNGSTLFYHHDAKIGAKYYVVVAPQPGEWRSLVNGASMLPSGNYGISYPMKVSNALITQQLESSNTEADTAIVVTASLESFPSDVTDVNAAMYFYEDNGRPLANTGFVDLVDDGSGYDAAAGDNIFTGIFHRPDTASYTLVPYLYGTSGGYSFVRQTLLNIPPCDLDLFVAGDSIACGGNVKLSSLSGKAGLIRYFEWNFGDGTTLRVPGDSIEVVHHYPSVGSYEIAVRAVSREGCTTTAHRHVSVNHLPNVALNVQGDTTLCDGASLQIAVPAEEGVTYEWNTSPPQTTAAITITTGGSFFVRATGATGCIAFSDTVNVSLSPRPDTTLVVSGKINYCQEESIHTVLHAVKGYSSYRWNGNPPTTSDSLVVNSPGIYFAILTNSFECIDTTRQITVRRLPAVVPRIDPPEVPHACSGDSVLLDAGPGFAIYRWSTGETTRRIKVIDVINQPDPQASLYSVEVADAAGCTGADTVTVVTFSPFPVITASDEVIFAGDTVILTARSGAKPRTFDIPMERYWAGSLADDFASYLWSTGETTSTISVHPTTTTTYTVVVTDESGCRGTTAITVQVLPFSAPNAGPDMDACVTSSFFMNATAPAVGAGTWSVVSGTGTFVDVHNPKTLVYGHSRGANVYRWTMGTPPNSASDDVTVTVGSDISCCPRTTITASTPVLCPGQSTRLTAEHEGEPVSYLWSTGETTQSINVTQPGEYWVSVVGSRPYIDPAIYGCFTIDLGNGQAMTYCVDPYWAPGYQCTSVSLPFHLVAGNSPTLSIAFSQPGQQAICGDEAIIKAVPNTFPGYSWSYNSTVIGHESEQLVSVAGTYQLAVTDSNGCVGTTSRLVDKVVAANAGPMQGVCTPSATMAGNFPQKEFGVTGTWSVIQGAAKIASVNAAQTVVTSLGVGENILRWTFSASDRGCGSTSSDVIINYGNGQPTLARAGADTAFCQGPCDVGQSFSMRMRANSPTNGVGKWIAVNEFMENLYDPRSHYVFANCTSDPVDTLVWEVRSGCAVSRDTMYVFARNPSDPLCNPCLQMMVNAGPDQNVALPSATLSATSTPSQGTWTRVSGSGTIVSPNSPTTQVTGLGAGNNVFRYTVTRPNCTPKWDEVVVRLTPTTQLAAPFRGRHFFGLNNNCFADAYTGAQQYIWKFERLSAVSPPVSEVHTYTTATNQLPTFLAMEAAGIYLATQNTTYAVSIALKVGNVVYPYGPVYNVTFDDMPDIGGCAQQDIVATCPSLYWPDVPNCRMYEIVFINPLNNQEVVHEIVTTPFDNYQPSYDLFDALYNRNIPLRFFTNYMVKLRPVFEVGNVLQRGSFENACSLNMTIPAARYWNDQANWYLSWIQANSQFVSMYHSCYFDYEWTITEWFSLQERIIPHGGPTLTIFQLNELFPGKTMFRMKARIRMQDQFGAYSPSGTVFIVGNAVTTDPVPPKDEEAATARAKGNESTSGEHSDEAVQVTIFPNPTRRSLLTVTGNFTNEVVFTLTNGLGREVLLQHKLKQIDGGRYTIDLSGESAGAYVIRITDGPKVITRKLMLLD